MKKNAFFRITIFFVSVTISLYTRSAYIYSTEDDDTNNYVEYDYTTGKETSFSIENDSLNTYNDQSSLTYNINETPDISVNSIMPNKPLTKVNALSKPYCKVLYLNLGRDFNNDGVIDDWTGGTGFLVSHDIMLTAGHCMYNKEYGCVDKMRIYTMQNSSSRNSDYSYPSKWVMSTEYINNLNPNYDWCVVKLQESIGYETGWFGYATASTSKNISVSGYPDSTEYHYYQYKSSGTLNIYNKYQFSHNCSTLGGVSGAPAYDSNNVVWGIHTSGSDSKNYGCLITSNISNLIKKYK